MATTTHYVASAKFKTGRLQRELFEEFTANATVKAHIGEVQSAVWDEETRKICKDNGVNIL